MKKFIIKLKISILLWLEEILGIYRDVSTASRFYEKKNLYSELDNIIFGINYCNSIKREKLISTKLSGLIISGLKLANYNKVYVTRNNEELKKQIENCFLIDLEKNELGYKYNNITKSIWSIEVKNDIKEKIILALITLDELKKRE